MNKKFWLLMCFVFVISFFVSVKASTPIDDWRFNFSWEYDPNGEPNLCHTATMEDSLAWNDNYELWVGVDVNCGHEPLDCDNCKDWLLFPDGNVVAFLDGGGPYIYQILDPNIDPNVIITEGMEYKMTVDLLTYDDWYFDVSFFYASDSNFLPDGDANEIVMESFLLLNIEDPVSGKSDWIYDNVVSFIAEPIYRDEKSTASSAASASITPYICPPVSSSIERILRYASRIVSRINGGEGFIKMGGMVNLGNFVAEVTKKRLGPCLRRDSG